MVRSPDRAEKKNAMTFYDCYLAEQKKGRWLGWDAMRRRLGRQGNSQTSWLLRVAARRHLVVARHLGDMGVGLIEAEASRHIVRPVQLDPDVAPTSFLGGDQSGG